MLARYISSSSSNTGTKRSLVGLLLVVLALAVVVSTSYLLLSIAPAFSFLGACVAVSLLNLCAGGGIKESELGRKCCKNEPWSWRACKNGNGTCEEVAAATMPKYLSVSLYGWMACESTRDNEGLQLSPAVTATFWAWALPAAVLAFRAKACTLTVGKLFFMGLLFWVRSISLSRSGRPRRSLLCRQPSVWPVCISVREKPQMLSCLV